MGEVASRKTCGVKVPRGARAAIAAAAEIKNISHSEYVRQALLRCLEADGVKLRRGKVEVLQGGCSA
jgi:hypothetical protein